LMIDDFYVVNFFTSAINNHHSDLRASQV